MGSVFDLIGSYIVYGAVILIILSLQANMTSARDESTIQLNAQESAANLARVLEFDLYKVGYFTSGTAFTLADSQNISFKSDIDANGTADSVIYKIGKTTQLSGTANKNDRPLTRRINTGTNENIAFGLTGLNFKFLDSLGANIPYDSLKNAGPRDRIRSIVFSVKTESTIKTGGTPSVIQKRIRPRNLQRS